MSADTHESVDKLLTFKTQMGGTVTKVSMVKHVVSSFYLKKKRGVGKLVNPLHLGCRVLCVRVASLRHLFNRWLRFEN